MSNASRVGAEDGVHQRIGVSPREAADILGVSLSTIHRRLSDGTLPRIQHGGTGKKIVIPFSALSATADLPKSASISGAPLEHPMESGDKPDKSQAASSCRLPGPRLKWNGTDYVAKRSQANHVTKRQEEAGGL